MRAVIGALGALLLVVSASVATAADVVGKVQMIDVSARVVALEDGTKLWVAEGVAIDSFKEGDSLKASYEERDGKNMVTGLEVSN